MRKLLSFIIVSIAIISCASCGAKGDGSVLFTTEYDIEDYCQGCFIVSKSDGLLYGVLDMKGKEILPVIYDNIYFLNKDEVVEGYQDNVYLQAKYENETGVYNNKGKQIFDIDVYCIDRIIDADADSPFFYSDETKCLYKEDGSVFLNYQGINTNIDPRIDRWISNECFLRGGMLYNANNKLIKSWEPYELEKSEIIDGKIKVVLRDVTASYTADRLEVVIDKNGNVLDETKSKYLYIVDSSKSKYLGKDEEIKLYETNDTWKLEDKNGTPLYDERYYDCYKYDEDDNLCYLLSNEDYEVCLINRNGKKIVDYGFIKLIEGDYDSIYLNDMKTSNKIYEGIDSVCFAVENNEEWDVYYFSEK